MVNLIIILNNIKNFRHTNFPTTSGILGNYIVFGFYQVTFTNCKQPQCQVLLTKDSSDSDFNFVKGQSEAELT